MNLQSWKNSNRKLPPAAALMTPRPPAPRVAPQLVPPPDLPGWPKSIFQKNCHCKNLIDSLFLFHKSFFPSNNHIILFQAGSGNILEMSKHCYNFDHIITTFFFSENEHFFLQKLFVKSFSLRALLHKWYSQYTSIALTAAASISEAV